jgi:hypothetical protein
MRRLRTTAHRVPTSASLVMAALLGLVSTTFAATPASAVPPYTVEERAAAIASPALVLVDVAFEGYLRVRATGELVYDQPMSVHNRCTGIVVNADGNVITPTHCVSLRADDLRTAATGVVVDEMVRVGKVAAADRESFLSNVRKNADFTGTTKDAPPVVSVSAQLFVATNTTDAAIKGKVVKSQASDKGDVTLIKLDAKGLPVAKLGKTAFSPGDPVVFSAFTSQNPGATQATFTVDFKVQRIQSPYGTADPPTLFRHDGDLGPTWHGGMILDNDGNVIGIITTDQSSTNRAPRLAQDTTPIFALLGESGVSNEQTDLDRTYRAGLDSYYAGRYRDAIKKFDAVLKAQPNNVPASTFREQSNVRMAVEGDNSPLLSPLVLIGLGGLAVLIIAGLVVALLVRGRRLKAREREVAQYEAYLPISGVPVSGLPVSGLPISGVPTSGIPPASGLPTSGVPVSTGTPWVSNTGSWVVPVSTPPGYAVPDQTGAPEYVPPASPTTPPAGAPPDGSQDTSANWPAVTVWRTPEGEGSEPPPAPQQRVKTNPWGPPPQETPPGS